MEKLPFLALVVVAVATAFVGGLLLHDALDDHQPVVLSADPGSQQPPAAGLPGGGGDAGGGGSVP